jgi:hypothetical protein
MHTADRVTIRFTKEKETKNTIRYQEQPDEGRGAPDGHCHERRRGVTLSRRLASWLSTAIAIFAVVCGGSAATGTVGPDYSQPPGAINPTVTAVRAAAGAENAPIYAKPT